MAQQIENADLDYDADPQGDDGVNSNSLVASLLDAVGVDIINVFPDNPAGIDPNNLGSDDDPHPEYPGAFAGERLTNLLVDYMVEDPSVEEVVALNGQLPNGVFAEVASKYDEFKSELFLRPAYEGRDVTSGTVTVTEDEVTVFVDGGAYDDDTTPRVYIGDDRVRLEIDSPGGEGIDVQETRDTGASNKETTVRFNPGGRTVDSVEVFRNEDKQVFVREEYDIQSLSHRRELVQENQTYKLF